MPWGAAGDRYANTLIEPWEEDIRSKSPSLIPKKRASTKKTAAKKRPARVARESHQRDETDERGEDEHANDPLQAYLVCRLLTCHRVAL